MSKYLYMNVALKDKFNIMKSISFTKGEINKLIYKKVGGSSIIRRGERKPTYMKFFEQGLKEKFFGERGIVTNQNIELQRYFLLEKLKRDNQLKQQINIGELTYLLLKNNDNLQQKRIDNYKQGHLERSKLFTYNTKHSSVHLKQQSSSEIKHPYIHTHNNSTDNKAYTKLTIKGIKPSLLNINQSNEKTIQFQSRNKTHNNKHTQRVQTYSGIGTSPSNHFHKHLNISISPFHYADTINNNNYYNHTIANSKQHNDIFPPSLHVDNMNTIVPHTERISIIDTDNKSSLVNLRKTKTNIKHKASNSFNNSKKRKLFIETFFKKATLVQSKQTKMDKALYKIMSKSKQAMKNKKQIPLVLKKDIELIIGKRIKRRKKCESLEIPNDGKYSYMGKKKAEMLEISDNIMHMRDNTLKEFGNQIQLSYWKKSDGNESNNPIESKYIKEEVERKKMLNKLNCGLELMHKLSYKMLHKKNKVIDG